MEIEGAHDALEVLIAFAAEEFDAEPVGARVGAGRGNQGWGNVSDDVEGRGHEALFYAERAPGTNGLELGLSRVATRERANTSVWLVC